jgi:uncharacterized protein YcaQ
MPASLTRPRPITKSAARKIWLRAQRLDRMAPFGDGPEATRHAIEHLGYVQIDTINVVERSHHHILFSRIPAYRREHLHHAQTIEKSVFEYWTHALSYVPSCDIRYFLGRMNNPEERPLSAFNSVDPEETRRVVARIKKNGPLSIRDIKDDVLVEKDHPWASRKPSKRALQHAFFAGRLAVSERAGMLKTYELIERHFGWERRPRPASEKQVLEYALNRALRAQGIVSLDSICFLEAGRKTAMRDLIQARVRRRRLVPVSIDGIEGVEHWAEPVTLDAVEVGMDGLVHILSPFDPLVIQRKRLQHFFDYEHRFEAYLPKDKRQFGYFTLPVLFGDQIVAAIDLKADRVAEQLLVQQWTWVGNGTLRSHKTAIEEALHRFEQFQLAA